MVHDKCAKRSQFPGSRLEAGGGRQEAATGLRQTKPIWGRGPWDFGLRISDCGLKDRCLQ